MTDKANETKATEPEPKPTAKRECKRTQFVANSGGSKTLPKPTNK